VIAVNTYDADGLPSSTNNTYAGRSRNKSTCLNWASTTTRHGVYAPTLGRFMQTDPIGYGDGMSWYNMFKIIS